MEFDVRSGSWVKNIEAKDFNHAVKLFLLAAVAEVPNPKLGDLISVSCKAKESFFDTNDALIELVDMDSTSMTIYNGEIEEK
jgi:hypothetical protein